MSAIGSNPPKKPLSQAETLVANIKARDPGISKKLQADIKANNKAAVAADLARGMVSGTKAAPVSKWGKEQSATQAGRERVISLANKLAPDLLPAHPEPAVDRVKASGQITKKYQHSLSMIDKEMVALDRELEMLTKTKPQGYNTSKNGAQTRLRVLTTMKTEMMAQLAILEKKTRP
jgi:hypothetical protein